MPTVLTPTASYSPEYLNEYNGESLRAIAILFIFLVTICVTLRFYARRLGQVAWGWDDTLIIPGTVFCLAVCATSLADLDIAGLGYHQIVIVASDPEKLVRWAKFVLIIPVLYLSAVLFPKLAILAIYLRVFTTPPYRITCWVLAAIMIANWTAFTVGAFTMCRPLEYLWDKTIVGGHCFDINLFYRWSAFPNIVTDVAMLVLPLPVIWKLHTSQNIKIGLTITFLTGSIGLLTSVLRFAGFFYHNPTVDVTRSGMYLLIYVICECCMYLIAACLPTYRPLAALFQKDGAWSLHSLKLRVPSHDSSHAKSERSDIPLGNLKNTGFERLDDDKPNLAKAQEVEYVV